jgi:hypothetical protein
LSTWTLPRLSLEEVEDGRCLLCSQEYISRYNDLLLTANGLGLQTLDEQRYWEALAHRQFAPRIMTHLRTAASAAF